MGLMGRIFGCIEIANLIKDNKYSTVLSWGHRTAGNSFAFLYFFFANLEKSL
jgi:hypothetical protein